LILVVGVLLVVITFPLWNPRKLSIDRQIRDLGDPAARGQAVQVLSQEIGAPAVEPLIDALDAADPQVRAGAWEALVAIGTPSIKPLIASVVENGPGRELLIATGAPAVEPLLAALEDPGLDGYRIGVLKGILVSMGTPAVEPLIAAARDVSPLVRLRAVQVLFCKDCNLDGCILEREPPTGDALTRMTELLTALSSDADARIRRLVVDSLSGLPWMADQRVPLLIAAVEDESSSVRSEAARWLGLKPDERAVPALAAALTDETPEVRGAAALALAQTGDAGTKALVAAFDDNDLSATAADYERIIQAGDKAAVPGLIAALFSHGDGGMAVDLLNCGEWRLKSAAEAWARRNGYEITLSSAGQGPGLTWGGK